MNWPNYSREIYCSALLFCFITSK